MDSPIITGGPDLPPTLMPIVAPNSPICQYTRPPAGDITLGMLIIVGTILSFVPQIYAIWRRKTVEGISLATVIFGMFGSMCTAINYTYLKWSLKQTCCKVIGFGHCLLHILDGEQLFVTFFCQLLLCVTWVLYFNVTEGTDDPSTKETVESRKKFLLLAKMIIFGSLVFFSINILVAGLLHFVFHSLPAAYWIGGIVGIIGALVVLVQLSPQIWTTWKLQQIGSLSVVTIAIQFPGCLSVIYFQAIVNKASWTTWIPYAVSAVQFAVLLTLCGWILTRDFLRRRFAQQLADTHPEYSFEELEQNIPSRRIVINDPTSLDEMEAENMMNLEFDEFDNQDESASTSFGNQYQNKNQYINVNNPQQSKEYQPNGPKENVSQNSRLRDEVEQVQALLKGMAHQNKEDDNQFSSESSQIEGEDDEEQVQLEI